MRDKDHSFFGTTSTKGLFSGRRIEDESELIRGGFEEETEMSRRCVDVVLSRIGISAVNWKNCKFALSNLNIIIVYEQHQFRY